MLSTTKEDRRDIGPSRDELLTVWEACSLGRAFGADQIPKEATAASPDCLGDFLRVVGASIFQEDVSSGMMLVMFVLLEAILSLVTVEKKGKVEKHTDCRQRTPLVK